MAIVLINGKAGVPKNKAMLIRNFFFFVVDLFVKRDLVIRLAKRDFKSRYLGSYLGLLWAFIHPSVTIAVFWFVFQVGFKSKPVNNYPFILWLMTGIIPWFFFSEALSGGSNSVVEYSYLVKKVLFRVSTLPIVKIISALVIHLFFIAVMVGFFLAYGYRLDLYALQLFYYLFAMMFFLLGLTWLTSALAVFIKDVGQVIAVFIQFGFWMTPIFWSIDILPAKYQIYIKLNPIYYLTEGYRDALIHKVWFWEHHFYTMYFWMVSLLLFIVGAIVFIRLKPHFADVL